MLTGISSGVVDTSGRNIGPSHHSGNHASATKRHFGGAGMSGYFLLAVYRLVTRTLARRQDPRLTFSFPRLGCLMSSEIVCRSASCVGSQSTAGEGVLNSTRRLRGRVCFNVWEGNIILPRAHVCASPRDRGLRPRWNLLSPRGPSQRYKMSTLPRGRRCGPMIGVDRADDSSHSPRVSYGDLIFPQEHDTTRDRIPQSR